MGYIDRGSLSQIGDGARDFYDAVIGAGGKSQFVHGLFQQSRRLGIDWAEAVNLHRCQGMI